MYGVLAGTSVCLSLSLSSCLLASSTLTEARKDGNKAAENVERLLKTVILDSFHNYYSVLAQGSSICQSVIGTLGQLYKHIFSNLDL